MSVFRPPNSKWAPTCAQSHYHKYKSAVFLSGRFAHQSAAQSCQPPVPETHPNHCRTSNNLIESDKTRLCHSPLLYQTMQTSDKIRVLRTPTDPNKKAQPKFADKFKFPIQAGMRKNLSKIKTLRQSSGDQLAGKGNIHETSTRKDLKQIKTVIHQEQESESQKKKVAKQHPTAKDKRRTENGQAETDRSIHTELQVETQRSSQLNPEPLNNHLSKCSLRDPTDDSKDRNVRWASKSSYEWIEEDRIISQEERREKNQKKAKVNKGKADRGKLLIPKSCLYMSMYLRSRDKEETIENDVSSVELTTGQNFISITKIPNPPQKRCHLKQYFLKVKQSQSVFNNFSYSALASKLRCKKTNKGHSQLGESIDGAFHRTNQRNKPPTSMGRSFSRKCKRKDSNRLSAGHGPTITIDPW